MKKTIENGQLIRDFNEIVLQTNSTLQFSSFWKD